MNVRRCLKPAFYAAAVAVLVGTMAALPAAQEQNGSASLSGFYLPGFGADGFKSWDIQGRESHVNATDNSQLEITDLLLRLYSGGEKGRLEMSIKSAAATVKTANAETQVNGPAILYLNGANDSYSVSGYDWWWNSKTHLIHLGRGVTVKFNSTANASSSTTNLPPHPIIILSDTLDIDQQPGKDQQPAKNIFTFKGNISIADQDSKSDPHGEFHTTCNELEVIASRATAGGATVSTNSTTAANNLPASLAVDKDSVESIIAKDHVVMRQGAIEAKGGGAQLFPSNETVVMADSPQVRVKLSGNATEADDYALLEGGVITWLRNNQELKVVPTASSVGNPSGTVKVSLPSTNSSASDARLIITGETLDAQFGAERRFDLENQVHVVDPRYTVEADHLDAEFDPPAKSDAAPANTSVPTTGNAPLSASDPASQLGKLNHLALANNVTIQQANLLATTAKAEIQPDDKNILLTGKSHIVDTLNNATVDASAITLATDGRRIDIQGAPGLPSLLTLPALPLGEASANIATTISSDTVVMLRERETSQITFNKNVRVNASSLQITSGQLEVSTKNIPAPEGASPAVDALKRVEIVQLVASDHVLVTQPGFKARAAEVEVNPLVGDPKIITTTTVGDDTRAYRMLQLKGDPAGLAGPIRPEVEVPLDNFNYGANPSANTTTSTTVIAKISSDEQWLFTSPDKNYYEFIGNVSIDGGSFIATCDQMLVNCVQAKAAENAPANVSIPHLAVDNIMAEGHVRLTQGLRVSTSDHALITPREDKAVLTGNTVVIDNKTGRMQNVDITIELHDGKPMITATQATGGNPLNRPTIIIPQGALNMKQFQRPTEKDSKSSAP